MTTTHTNLALVEGEVWILSGESVNNVHGAKNHSGMLDIFGLLYLVKESKVYEILASTAKLEGTPQLDRKHFVKPKVDVDELAETEYKKRYGKDYFTSSEYDFQEGFKAGYNAKEAEFTERDLIDAMYSVAEYPNKKTHEETFSEFVKSYLKKLRPLSLPKSVTLNENNEVTHVEW